MNINNLDEKELQELKNKIKLREEDIKESKCNKQREEAKNIIEKIKNANILDLIEHTRTYCSDSNPGNGYDSSKGYTRCTKCQLIEIIEDHENGFNEFMVNLDVTISKID
jgi:hypothetical protein